MKFDFDALKRELRPMMHLALPVVAAELGWVAMGVVDIMMVGRIDAAAIGAVSLGRTMYLGVVIFGWGLLLGLDPLVAQAFGARNLRECHRALIQGLYVALMLVLPLMWIIRTLPRFLEVWGVDPTVRPLVAPYVDARSWSILPLLLYITLRRYLQAQNLVRPIMTALITANLVNIVANWLLIFGNLGLPAMGVRGAGWATCAAMWYLALFLLLVAFLREREEPTGLLTAPRRPDPALLRRLLALGLPAGLHLLLEVGVFATSTVLVGTIGAYALAAHQIALALASATYMVALGISSAAAVRVGQAIGRKEPAAAAAAGWTALLIGACFTLLAALAFVVFPRGLIRLFTIDERVIPTGVLLLLVAAAFQLFDGVQAIATGALRGTGDTRTPLVWNLVGYWVLGLPIGYALCFHAGLGAVGIWIGLSVGLIVVGVVLLAIWSRRVAGWRG